VSDAFCGYPGDRDETLVAYLYDDIDPAERAAFEAHLMTCVRCRGEVKALRGVRQQLGRWAPPEPARAPALVAPPTRRWWRDIPAWAQVAAALLVLGVSAGIANLSVRYDSAGLTVTTGWSRPAAAAPAAAAAQNAPWRADLAAFEQRLRTEFHAEPAGAATTQAASLGQPQAAAAAVNADLLNRVRALVQDSERRQERELALRIAEVVRDVDAQRQADLVRIDRSLGLVQNNTGVEVMRQRELINYLVRAAQKQ
jgi:anti-sigma factor RsiW